MLQDFFIPRVQGLPVNKTTYFQQDGATSHTAKVAMNILRPLFPGHLISRYGDIEWPARSPDLSVCAFYLLGHLNPLTPNDPYSGRTAPLTSKRCILYIYFTNICTEYFKRGIYSPFFPFTMQF